MIKAPLAFTFFALLSATFPLAAQYGPILDGLVESRELTAGAAVRFLGVAAGSVAPEMGEEEAQAILLRLGYRLPKAPLDGILRYGDLCLLVIQLYDLPGDVSYRLFPGPRTAFRSLRSLGLLPEGAHHRHIPSGTDLIILTRRLSAGRGIAP